MVLVGAVILGGVRRIAVVASWIVPFMSLAYVLMSLTVIAIHLSEVPAALYFIVSDAFTPTAAAGGDVPEVSLPDPSQTGAVDEAAKSGQAAGSTGGGGADDGDSTNAAADIIRQYTQRRPG